MNSLGIYVSIPFCRAKCSYCNFASGVTSAAAHAQYVSRVGEQVRSVRMQVAEAAVPGQVDSLYLGGGTPSTLSPALLRQLVSTLRQEFTLLPEAEFTVECAPGQLDDAILEALVAVGVNRLSFGVQSLVDREAAATGRYHTRAIVWRDLERVRAAGINRLSIDLIAGMPHQTRASWQESLQVLAATGVDHASVYMLEIDEDSRLGRELLTGGTRYSAPAVPSEELTADLYEVAVAFLEQQGLRQYEISNFARRGCSSRHNLKYWRRQPYLGFGLDAHSMLRSPAGSALRFQTTADLAGYLAGSGVEELRRLSPGEELEEAWFLGLRLREGVAWQSLAAEFGRERIESFSPLVEELCGLGLLMEKDGRVALTGRGVLLSNEVFARFLGVEELECQTSLSL